MANAGEITVIVYFDNNCVSDLMEKCRDVLTWQMFMQDDPKLLQSFDDLALALRNLEKSVKIERSSNA